MLSISLKATIIAATLGLAACSGADFKNSMLSEGSKCDELNREMVYKINHDNDDSVRNRNDIRRHYNKLMHEEGCRK